MHNADDAGPPDASTVLASLKAKPRFARRLGTFRPGRKSGAFNRMKKHPVSVV
jgi:hypothetical protein